MTNTPEQFNSLVNIIAIGRDALEGVFNEISNGITITDEHSRIIYVNPAFTKITGYQTNHVIGDNPGILHSGRHNKVFYKKMWDNIHRFGRWQGEIWNRHQDGRIIPELLTITKIGNNQQGVFYIGIFSDLTSIIQKNKRKLNLALHDPLTKLCNRSLLEERFEVIFNDYKRNSSDHLISTEQTALIFIDLNHFKQLNDTHGHLAGDNMLIFIANSLTSCSRGIDTIARVGGDEFVVLLPKIKLKENVIQYCNRVREKISAGEKVNGSLLTPTISIGASFFPTDATTYEKLMRYADKAMYFSKSHQMFLTFFDDLQGRAADRPTPPRQA